jgi:cytidylate kinase/N-acetylglutamate synthase-like GNAT family acetyltransferase
VVPKIRQARPDECPALTELAMRSKAHWGYDAAFMANVRADLEVIPAKFMPGFHVYILETGNEMIGFYSLRPEDAETVTLEDLFIEPKHIGCGYGKRLWEHSLSVAQSLGFRRVTLISDPYAEPFYARRGAVKIGEIESNALAGRMLPLMEYVLAPRMHRHFVIVSGLPGSGKSTLGRQLADALGIELLDKDTVLERLFDLKGVKDLAWRRELSRESDAILRSKAIASNGAVLVSHWRLPGMPAQSGTPTEWLSELSEKIINVHCTCSPEIAAERFAHRKRHAGHCDSERSYSEILESIQALSGIDRLNIGQTVEVDTSHPPNLDDVLRAVREAFSRIDRS